MEEACEHGLPRGTCFVARRLELVAVAGRLWISWCIYGWADFYRISSSFLMRQRRENEATEVVFSQKSLLTMRQGRGSEATEAVFRL